MSDLQKAIRYVAGDIERFTDLGGGLKLRRYQVGVARAVVDSVLFERGLSFVVMFPRQSGKNELQAQIEAFLLARFVEEGGELVKVSPTWKPQSLNAMRRLERALERNFITRGQWAKEWGYIYRIGQARMFFLSGAPASNIVGATASLLLEVDEAQEIEPAKFDKEILPMAAAKNATRVFWGTAWTSDTLLAREMEMARREERDGQQRVFTLSAEEVAAEAPEYGKFVEEQVGRLGRNHPMVKSQFFSETVDEETRMFPAERQALMQGIHEPGMERKQNGMYALLVDVAGEDEEAVEDIGDTSFGELSGRAGGDGKRDSTAVTVVEVDVSTLTDAIIQALTYRVVQRYEWVGVKHATLYGRIKALAEHWQAWRVVVDATGVGAGLASFLERAFPGKVKGFVFSSQSKSKLGWDFLAAVETGRYKEYAPSPNPSPNPSPQSSIVERGAESQQAELQGRFWRQVALCEGRVMAGPRKILRWGVPDGRRDGLTGEVMHDDLLISAALCTVLEGETAGTGKSYVIPQVDPFQGMGKVF